jgi:hypothetical protein
MGWDWDAIVDSYSDLLSKPSNTGHRVRDASVLPYPRAIVREAMLRLLKSKRDPWQRDAIKGAYVALAGFQELTPEERQAIEVWSASGSRDSSLEETKAHAQRMLAMMPFHNAVMQRFQSDMQTFTADVANVP